MRSTFTDTLRSAAAGIYWSSRHLLSHVTGKAVILMYHRVLPRADVDTAFVQPGMYVTPETFERHLRFLTEHFELLTFRELLAKWDFGDWNDRARYCAITFDDGWVDNYRHAWPLLRRYGAPATIFLPTALIGSDARLWFDRLADALFRRGHGTRDEWDAVIERAKYLSDAERETLIDRLASDAGGADAGGADAGGADAGDRRFMTWDEVEEMSRDGIAFGSHSRSHANLTRLDAAALAAELRASLDALRARPINHVPVLAYPNGNCNREVALAAQSAGYRAAVTVRRGLERSFPLDRFRLKRIAVHEDVSRSAPALALHIGRQSLTRASHH
jgi:peptidoglycan/xylan/chitin deacetylase (PgdA/CDA1 family)